MTTVETAEERKPRHAEVRSTMSHFRNKEGMLIRTYASIVSDAKGSIVLVHGNRCHYRAEFAAYNMNWYLDTFKIGEPQVDDIVAKELQAVYPRGADNLLRKASSKGEKGFDIDGQNFFDLSPRFVYEGSFINKLNELGYNVYGLDHQSHGMSEGLKGRRNYYLDLENIVDDVIQFIDIVKRGQFENTEERYTEGVIGGPSQIGKIYLAGISMGGFIVLRTAQKTAIYNQDNHMFVDGLIAFAPMCDLSSYTASLGRKIQLLVTKMLACCCPAATCMVPNDRIINNMNTFVRGQDPHFFNGKQCYGVILSLIAATKTLHKNYHLYPENLPTLVVHCDGDDTVSVKGSRELTGKILKDHKDLKYVELKGNVHCLTSVLYNENIMPHVSEWLARVNA
ncbi:lysophospholipase, putative [Babesia bigemina]|uniref:Lysophospholipase, putative n=1 Tax=Babesia bigemina TaxID=5866 RepID=A0A061D6G7_BABBI|nr:lysophospholipase, putative [Babesia bigemina]CDR94529.1 lysophospholipase, putative [Babesia bigemina]|eukprot:XP_012766715.1 lysophospholipase, putative [Babesia bigemina]